MQVQTKSKKWDIVIVGAGPAGLAAAIYGKRANLSVVFIEKEAPGGKMVKTNWIGNYPGIDDIDGPDLAIKMYEHAHKLGSEFIAGEVVKINHLETTLQEVILSNNQRVYGQFVLIATGMVENVPPIPRINELKFHGVNYCATCDGALFKNKEVAIVGSGNSAIEEAVYLSSIVKHLYLFSITPELTADDKQAIEHFKTNKKIDYYLNATVTKLLGDKKLNGIETNLDGTKKVFPNVVGLFPYVGASPQTDFVKELNITNKLNYIIVDENMCTKVPGILAAGDVIEKGIRQIVTAASDGTIAAKHIANNINND